MHAHIVLAHPEKTSFNAHLAEVSRQSLNASGWQTSISDLYAMDFDPREGPQHYAARALAAATQYSRHLCKYHRVSRGRQPRPVAASS